MRTPKSLACISPSETERSQLLENAQALGAGVALGDRRSLASALQGCRISEGIGLSADDQAQGTAWCPDVESASDTISGIQILCGSQKIRWVVSSVVFFLHFQCTESFSSAAEKMHAIYEPLAPTRKKTSIMLKDSYRAYRGE